MSDRTYPYIAWVLTPGFKPKEVEITGDGGRHWSEYLTINTGKIYHEADTFATKAEAVAAGFAKCVDQQATIDKRQATLDKRRRTLEAAQKSA